MKPVEPAELSAFLDGELSSVRASEVAAALASSSALRAQFDALAGMDAAWQSAADAARFAPQVQLSRNEVFFGSWLGTVAVLVVLVAVRILPKVSDTLEFGFVLHGLGLAIVLAWVTGLAREAGLHGGRTAAIDG